jgi:hypothetical protein
MSFVPVNPRPFLQDLVNKDVIVRLKWGETEYKGRLVVRFEELFFSLSHLSRLLWFSCVAGDVGLTSSKYQANMTIPPDTEHRQLHEHPALQHGGVH